MTDLDQSRVSRLANIKGVYEHALLLLDNPTPLEGAIALVLMDDALEAAFKLALDQSGQTTGKSKRDPDFATLFQATLEVPELRDELSKYRLAVLALRTARNGFQHQGVIPDLNSVLKEYKPVTEQILALVCKRMFALRFEDISMSLLIRDEAIRDLYRRSEESYTRGDYISASAYLVYTFEAVKSIAASKISGSGLLLLREEIDKRYSKDDPLVKYVSKLDEEIESFKLGLSYPDLQSYLDVSRFLGIDGVLDYIDADLEKDLVIDEFKRRLEERFKEPSLLKEWYVRTKGPVLEFIIRTEARWRLSLEILKAVVADLSKMLKGKPK